MGRVWHKGKGGERNTGLADLERLLYNRGEPGCQGCDHAESGSPGSAAIWKGVSHEK